MDLSDLTLSEQAALLRQGQCSSREIVDAHLRRIERFDGKLHAYVEVYAAAARELALGADRARSGGLPLGPLHGLPICIKDLCDIAGRIGTMRSLAELLSGR
ncbi:MAG: amidase family protein, partial [Burkholderiales bacterium]